MALLMGLMGFPTQGVIGPDQRIISVTIAQSMMRRHTCICCSNILLRHVRPGEIYWRCSHCYQEMPV